jgi:hypothetical protein
MLDLASLISALVGSLITVTTILFVPAVRTALVKYVSGFVQHQFDQRLEKLRHNLRSSEERFSSYLRTNEQRLKSLTDTALSLRSTRQVALDGRRLMAVEKLWAAKIATDRFRVIAHMVSLLKMEEVLKLAKQGDPRVQQFGTAISQTIGGDLTNKIEKVSALSEQPFLSNQVWQLFSAYQGVIMYAVLVVQALSSGVADYIKKEDTLKPLMLLSVPEYAGYIEQFGISGYYHLLDILEQKLLISISEMLDGKATDDLALKQSAAIISAAHVLTFEPKLEIPEYLQGSEIPPPSKKLQSNADGTPVSSEQTKKPRSNVSDEAFS